MHPLGTAPFDLRRFSANNGRCDAQGRFLFGAMYHPLEPAPAKEEDATPVFRSDAVSKRSVPLTRDIAESNGMRGAPTDARCTVRPQSGKPSML
jgi:sugar lactone lactonase YvrE